MSAQSASSSRPKRGPGRPRGGQVLVDRDQLLAAAITAIREHGPDVTMVDIAAAATVTKPILYRTIGDKEALTNALSEMLIDRVNTAVGDQLGSGGGDPGAEFRGAVRGYLSAIDADRNLFLFVNSGSHDTGVVQRLVDRSARQLIESFTMSSDAAGLDDAAARTWSYAIIGAFQIVSLMWLRDDYCDIDTLADDLTRLLWPGVSSVGG